MTTTTNRRAALWVIVVVWLLGLVACVLCWRACVHAQAGVPSKLDDSEGYRSDAILWGFLGLALTAGLLVPIGYALHWAAAQLGAVKE